jgi:hypothetical protein
LRGSTSLTGSPIRIVPSRTTSALSASLVAKSLDDIPQHSGIYLQRVRIDGRHVAASECETPVRAYHGHG